MRERQILFSAPMIRAILDGRKTQTRRVVKPPHGWESQYPHCDPFAMPPAVWWWIGANDHVGIRQECPYGQPGDRLWVKETWRTYRALDTLPPRSIAAGAGVQYEAGGSNVPGKRELHDTIHDMGKVRPSIFMPRWASRITLEVTGVRVERLQAISEADAKAEGAPLSWATGQYRGGTWRQGFAGLWSSINGAGSWAANHRVWVVEFKRVTA